MTRPPLGRAPSRHRGAAALALATESAFARPPPKSAAAAAAARGSARARGAREGADLIREARFKRAAAEMAELTALRRARPSSSRPRRNGFRRGVLLSPDGVLVPAQGDGGRPRTFPGATGPGFGWAPRNAWTLALGDVDAEHALVLGTHILRRGAPRPPRAPSSIFTRSTPAATSPFAVARLLFRPSTVPPPPPPRAPVRGAGGRRPDGRRRFRRRGGADGATPTGRGFLHPPIASGGARVPLLPALLGSDAFDAAELEREVSPESGRSSGTPAARRDGATWTRVLGDRRPLFKYLSPNVIFAAAQTGAAHERKRGRRERRERAPDRRRDRAGAVPRGTGGARARTRVWEWWRLLLRNLKAGYHAMASSRCSTTPSTGKATATRGGEPDGAERDGDGVDLAPPPLRIMGQSDEHQAERDDAQGDVSRRPPRTDPDGHGHDQIAALEHGSTCGGRRTHRRP